VTHLPGYRVGGGMCPFLKGLLPWPFRQLGKYTRRVFAFMMLSTLFSLVDFVENVI
jgi:hypothetical protein